MGQIVQLPIATPSGVNSTSQGPRRRAVTREGDLRTLAAAYVTGRVQRGELGANSGRVIAERLKTFTDMFERTNPVDITRQDMLEWQASIGHLAPASRRAYVSAVSKFCRWLVVEGHMPTDPTVALEKVKEPRRAPRTLSPDQVAAVIDTCATVRGKAILSLMVGCGLRCVEVSNLDLADVDLTAATVLVRGKGGHERILPIPDFSFCALAKYLDERGWIAGPLFLAVGSKGLRDRRLSARWVSKRTAQIMHAAGVHQPWDGRAAHSLRRTAASDVLDRSHDIRLVQQMLGHANVGTTERYLRYRDLDQLRAAMEGREYQRPTIGVSASLRGVPGPGAASPAAGDPTEGRHPYLATQAS